MKKLDIIDKLIFFINLIFAIGLLVGYVIPYLDPEKFSSLSILSLGYPIILSINLFFVLYWLVKLKIQFLTSLICIALGFSHLQSFISFKNKEVLLTNDVKILSYNVRRYNQYQWIASPTIKKEICDFIEKQKADVICLQEHKNAKGIPKYLPYQFQASQNGLITYSKFPIIGAKVFDFSKNGNNVIRTDLLTKKDTIRLYNVHFQSYRIEKLTQEPTGKRSLKEYSSLFSNTFKSQAKQVKEIKQDLLNSPYKTMIVGDFNNTAFSWLYNELTENKKDAFKQAGFGFGNTFDFLFPLRIDFILVDESISVNQFQNFNIKLSDHKPILARINISK